MRAREPDPLETLDLVDAREQLREVARRVVRGLVMVHDLSEELDFPRARRDRLPHVREDVIDWAHPLVTARVRHHAEGAEVVAALDDRDVRLQRIAAASDPQRERHVVMRTDVEERLGACPRDGFVHEERQAFEGLRADQDVDRPAVGRLE